MVVLAGLSIFIGEFATNAEARGSRPRVSDSACYGNQFVYSENQYGPYLDGTGVLSSAGSASFKGSELEFPGLPEADNGGGIIRWIVRASITGPNSEALYGPQSPGGITGLLRLTIAWNNGATTDFTSRCIAEAQTDASPAGNFEVEFEGVVDGFPNRPGSRAAVVSMKMQRDGTLKGAFGIELGSTCFEQNALGQETEVGFAVTDGAGDLSATNADVGRWAFPTGFGPGNCPGAY